MTLILDSGLKETFIGSGLSEDDGGTLPLRASPIQSVAIQEFTSLRTSLAAAPHASSIAVVLPHLPSDPVLREIARLGDVAATELDPLATIEAISQFIETLPLREQKASYFEAALQMVKAQQPNLLPELFDLWQTHFERSACQLPGKQKKQLFDGYQVSAYQLLEHLHDPDHIHCAHSKMARILGMFHDDAAEILIARLREFSDSYQPILNEADRAEITSLIEELTEFKLRYSFGDPIRNAAMIRADILALEDGKSLLVPGGYYRTDKSGHAIVYEIKRTGETYTFSIFNTGEGSTPSSSKPGHCLVISYRDLTIDCAGNLDFLQELMTYTCPSPHHTIAQVYQTIDRFLPAAQKTYLEKTIRGQLYSSCTYLSLLFLLKIRLNSETYRSVDYFLSKKAQAQLERDLPDVLNHTQEAQRQLALVREHDLCFDLLATYPTEEALNQHLEQLRTVLTASSRFLFSFRKPKKPDQSTKTEMEKILRLFDRMPSDWTEGNREYLQHRLLEISANEGFSRASTVAYQAEMAEGVSFVEAASKTAIDRLRTDLRRKAMKCYQTFTQCLVLRSSYPTESDLPAVENALKTTLSSLKWRWSLSPTEQLLKTQTEARIVLLQRIPQARRADWHAYLGELQETNRRKWIRYQDVLEIEDPLMDRAAILR